MVCHCSTIIDSRNQRFVKWRNEKVLFIIASSPTIEPNHLLPAVLALASGEIYHGLGFGYNSPITGEIVFNTSQTGYQEVVTDPSYQGQIVCMTYPHIGNVGVNQLDYESDKVQATGLIVRSLSRTVSSWRATGSLATMLTKAKVAGICEIDTRALTRKLRELGAINGCIATGADIDQALKLAKQSPPMLGRALGAIAGEQPQQLCRRANWQIGTNSYPISTGSWPKVAILNCGSKQAILRELATRNLQVTVLPYSASVEKIIEAGPHGVIVSNGPGDPEPLTEATATITALMANNIPLLCICLGHQLFALAAGAKTEKMKFGHHGTNHPVVNHANNQIAITSQNHGFAVSAKNLPSELAVTHSSLFDGSIQGLRHRTAPVISFQGHPEASPGPHEMASLFDEFANLVNNHAKT